MRCRGCNCEIKVVWWLPPEMETPILEDLCLVCQGWAEVAKQNGPMPEPSLKRKPVERCINYDAEDNV